MQESSYSTIEMALRGVIELAITATVWRWRAKGLGLPDGDGTPGSSHREQAELLVAELLSDLSEEYLDDREEVA